ncbi:hypothetical protein GCM10022239_09450 [Leifsonia bigeumensis]|uniref:Uncharacterized protein n=1 Tax=Leifsonella bigeumensis TaxID=433643 RepID=A0ABP7FGW4_9MICO
MTEAGERHRSERGAGSITDRLVPIGVAFGFGWIFVSPVSHNYVLYPLFALLGFIALVTIMRRNPTIDMHLWVIAFLTGALALYGMIRGNGNTGLVFTIAIFVAAPALYLLCAAAASLRLLRLVMIAAVVGTLTVSGLLLIYVAGEAGLIPQIVPSRLEEFTGLKATFRDGSSQARSWGLSSLAALGPIWVGSLLVRRDAVLPHWMVRLVCGIAALATAVVSSRTAVVLVIGLAPLLAIALILILRHRDHHTRLGRQARLLWAGGSITAVIVLLLTWPKLSSWGPVANVVDSIASFFGAVSTNGEANQDIRSDQAWHLIRAWQADPILGSGFGAIPFDYARTSERPWVLELQYHLLLFNVGLVGITMCLAILVIGLLFLRQASARRPELVPTLVVAGTGAIAMLIANATNPYLQAPGHQWAVFFPLAVAVVMLKPTEAVDAARLAPDGGAKRKL